MNTTETITALRRLNDWRKGNRTMRPDADDVTRTIDTAIDLLQSSLSHQMMIESLTLEIGKALDAYAGELRKSKELQNLLDEPAGK